MIVRIGYSVLLLTAFSLNGQSPRPLAITSVNVVDVVGGRILPSRTVVIKGDLISTITTNGSPPSDASIIDGQLGFLIPGLWDMHAHTGGGSGITPWHKAWLQLYIANGVTGIRDMGSDLDVILAMRRGTSMGDIVGPRIFAAGPILDDAPGDWPLRMRVKTAEDGRRAVQILNQRGVDLIKVHDHTPREAFFAIAEEARHLGLPLAGHVPLGLSAEQVIQAGQGDIEHLSNMRLWRRCSGGAEYRPEACRAFFETLARRGIWQTPTLFNWSEIATIGTPDSSVGPEELAYASKALKDGWALNRVLSKTTPEMIRDLRAASATGAAVTRAMYNLGVPILTGCDTMIAGFCVHDELELMVGGGMTPLGALQTATINPARYLGRESSLGSVEAGKAADLVLLDANPLTEIQNLRRIRAVVLGGRFLDRNELDRILAGVKLAAQSN
jgi:imidazolonepropionase-like amidohydrolase